MDSTILIKRDHNFADYEYLPFTKLYELFTPPPKLWDIICKLEPDALIYRTKVISETPLCAVLVRGIKKKYELINQPNAENSSEYCALKNSFCAMINNSTPCLLPQFSGDAVAMHQLCTCAAPLFPRENLYVVLDRATRDGNGSLLINDEHRNSVLHICCAAPRLGETTDDIAPDAEFVFDRCLPLNPKLMSRLGIFLFCLPADLTTRFAMQRYNRGECPLQVMLKNRRGLVQRTRQSYTDFDDRFEPVVKEKDTPFPPGITGQHSIGCFTQYGFRRSV
jgi:hypothetical protein